MDQNTLKIEWIDARKDDVQSKIDALRQKLSLKGNIVRENSARLKSLARLLRLSRSLRKFAPTSTKRACPRSSIIRLESTARNFPPPNCAFRNMNLTTRLHKSNRAFLKRLIVFETTSRPSNAQFSTSRSESNAPAVGLVSVIFRSDASEFAFPAARRHIRQASL